MVCAYVRARGGQVGGQTFLLLVAYLLICLLVVVVVVVCGCCVGRETRTGDVTLIKIVCSVRVS